PCDDRALRRRRPRGADRARRGSRRRRAVRHGGSVWARCGHLLLPAPHGRSGRAAEHARRPLTVVRGVMAALLVACAALAPYAAAATSPSAAPPHPPPTALTPPPDTP